MEKNIDKISWDDLSTNANAIHLLEQYQENIDFESICYNANIYTYDYEYYKKQMNVHREELMKKVYHPCRLSHYLEIGYDFAEM